jgi:CheY-like chemotaxis protein
MNDANRRHRPRNILVVDDAPAVRQFLADLLEAEGYTVFEAPNVKEALTRCRQTAIDLVVTDILMPEQEGLETIRALRNEWPAIPIIAISGSGVHYLHVAKTLGAAAVFSKPIVPDLILREIRRIICD